MLQSHIDIDNGLLRLSDDRLDEWFAPKVEIFTWSRQKWARPLDLPQFDHGAS